MKVPLANGCGRCSTLNPRHHPQRPEVHEDEEYAQPPGASIDNEDFCPCCEMSTKEDSGEHTHPHPSPYYHTSKGPKADDQEAWICSENAAGKLQYTDRFSKRMPAFVDCKRPKNCQHAGDEGGPAHGFVLNASPMVPALEAGDERIKEEGEKDDWDCHHDQVDERSDV